MQTWRVFAEAVTFMQVYAKFNYLLRYLISLCYVALREISRLLIDRVEHFLKY